MKKIQRILSLAFAIAITVTMVLSFSTTASAISIGDTWRLGIPDSSTVPNSGQFTVGMAYRTEAEVFNNVNYENYLSLASYGADITMSGYKKATLVGSGHVWSQGETAYFVGDRIPMPIDGSNRDALIFAHRAKDDTYHFFASVGRMPVVSFTAPVNGTYTYEVYVSFFNYIGVFTSKGNEPLKLTHTSVTENADRNDPQANSHAIYVYHKCSATVTLQKGETFNIAFGKLDGNAVASLVQQGINDFKNPAYDVKASFKSISFTLTDAQASDLNDANTTVPPTAPPPQTNPDTTDPIVTPPASSSNTSGNTSDDPDATVTDATVTNPVTTTDPTVTTDPSDTDNKGNGPSSAKNVNGGVLAAIILNILNLIVSGVIIVLMMKKK